MEPTKRKAEEELEAPKCFFCSKREGFDPFLGDNQYACRMCFSKQTCLSLEGNKFVQLKEASNKTWGELWHMYAKEYTNTIHANSMMISLDHLPLWFARFVRVQVHQTQFALFNVRPFNQLKTYCDDLPKKTQCIGLIGTSGQIASKCNRTTDYCFSCCLCGICKMCLLVQISHYKNKTVGSLPITTEALLSPLVQFSCCPIHEGSNFIENVKLERLALNDNKQLN